MCSDRSEHEEWPVKTTNDKGKQPNIRNLGQDYLERDTCGHLEE